MKRGPLGILIFLIVALLVAFLLMKELQNPTPLSERASQAVADTAVDAVQSAVDTINEAVQNSDLTERLQSMLGGAK